MNTLRPVDPGYDPGYPRRLGEAELRALLRRSLLERFSGATILSGALLAGCLPQVLAQEPASRPQAGRLPRPPRMAEPAFAKELQALVAELMGSSKGGFWDAHSAIALARPLPSNPPVKCPRIRISFGNSYVGIFDVEAAKQATRKLFAHYGVPLQEDVRVTGTGFEFVADGYDPERKVGFKIRVPAAAQLGRGKVAPAEPAERALEDQELQAVDRAVAKGELELFVVDGTAYPNMDNDLYTPMQYYLSSVVDYLNWVHGEEHIDAATVFGRLPGWVRGEQEPAPSFLPGGAFTEERDLKHWTLTKGHAGRSDRWCEPGGSCLRVELAPGGEARYVVPAGLAVELGPERRMVSFKLHVDGGDSSLVQATGLGARGEELELRLHPQGVRQMLFPPEERKVRLYALRLRSQSKAPVTFYLRDLSW
jgi:hypothetical protein